MSQAELVHRLREQGWTNVHPTTISRIENGERPVRLNEAIRIASILKTTPEEMATDASTGKLAEIRRMNRSIVETRTRIVHLVQKLYEQAYQLKSVLAEDVEASQMLSQEELKEVTGNANSPGHGLGPLVLSFENSRKIRRLLKIDRKPTDEADA